MIAKAFSNNDVALIFWSYDKKIKDCLGFSITRVDVNTKKKQVLPAWVGFKDQSNKDWKPKTTEVWPIQKFSWGDFTADRGKTYYYEIVPMIGTSNDLKPDEQNKLTTNQVSISSGDGPIKPYFNRGILSTQSVSHQIPQSDSGTPNYKVLIDRIDQPGDPLRNRLAGELRDALMALLKRVKEEGGECYCALYELNDPELISLILETKNVHIILSNTGPDDQTNDAVRQTLHESGIDIQDRMLANGHIGHNKFVVYVDKNKKPKAVLTGSTNWTYTGLCAQSNNALIIELESIAKIYMDYWHRLQEDGAEQGSALREEDNKVNDIKVGDTDINIWFSPNTEKKTKPKDPEAPSDMQEVFDLMDKAQKTILFLAFQPGTPSIIDQALQCQENKPNLFIRGAATDKKAVENYNVELFHRGMKQPDTVVAASAINDQFGYWQKELLKSSPMGHAIIHDKIVVIDPFSDDCVVITGSHNLGYKASYANDENLVIIKGNRKVAEAYAVHVLDIYDHYRWRYKLESNKGKATTFFGLEPSDSWQDYYYKGDKKGDLKFWQ